MKASIISLALILLHTSLPAAITLDFGFDVQFYPTGQEQTYDGLGLVGSHIDFRFRIDQETYDIPDASYDVLDSTADISRALMTITGASVAGVDGTYILTYNPDADGIYDSLYGSDGQLLVGHSPYGSYIVNANVTAQNGTHSSLADYFYVSFNFDPSEAGVPQPGDPVKAENFPDGGYYMSLVYQEGANICDLQYVNGTQTFSAVPEMKLWAVWGGMSALAIAVYTVSRREKGDDHQTDNKV